MLAHTHLRGKNMNELIKLSAAAVLVKAAAPDFINKLLGRPTKAQVKTLKILKTLLPIAGTAGLGLLGMDSISKKEKEIGNDPEALRELMKQRRLHDVAQGMALALATMPSGIAGWGK